MKTREEIHSELCMLYSRRDVYAHQWARNELTSQSLLDDIWGKIYALRWALGQNIQWGGNHQPQEKGEAGSFEQWPLMCYCYPGCELPKATLAQHNGDGEILSRDIPGVFEMWERDVAELIVNPENLGGLGACEPEQLAEMNVSGMAALANIILGLYHQWTAGTTALVWSRDVEVDGEIDDETLDLKENEFATYLTFDLRGWLKVGEAQEEPTNA
jgi:hypothetical protein